MSREVNQIAIPVVLVNAGPLLEILLELRRQSEEQQEQTKILKQIAGDVHSIWNQVDDAPVGFKVTETKL